MKPRRVLSVVGSLGFGGDESRLASMLSAVDPGLYRCSVALLPQAVGYDERAGSIRPVLEAASIDVFDLAQPLIPSWVPRPLAGLLRFCGRIAALVRLIHRVDADLVDARLDGGMLVGIPAAILTRRPAVSTLYSIEMIGQSLPLWRLFRWASLNAAAAVVTDSAVRQAQFTKWRWPRRGGVWRIPNGIPVPSPTRSPDEMRRVLSISDDAIVICQIAGIVPYKGAHVLLDAARRLVVRHPRVVVLLVGYCREAASYQEELWEKIAAWGLRAHVRMQPYPGPIGDVWQIVDIHAHASLFDSLPNAILEGMALGKPAIVTHVGGVTEAVQHEVTGLVVAAGDADALADGLCRLIDQPEEARAFGAAARARYEARYRPDAMARSVERCFASVL